MVIKRSTAVGAMEADAPCAPYNPMLASKKEKFRLTELSLLTNSTLRPQSKPNDFYKE